jgi:hypothetical protein
MMTPPPPVRADRIASAGNNVTRAKVDTGIPVTLVHADRKTQSKAVAQEGQFQAQLTSGTWHIYAKESDGKQVYRGKIDVRDAGPVTVRLR